MMNEATSAAGRYHGGQEATVLAHRNPTAFDAAQETFEAATVLVARIHDVVNRLAGHAPPSDAKGNDGIQSIANGTLDDLKDRSYRTGRAIASAQAALDRLESQV